MEISYELRITEWQMKTQLLLLNALSTAQLLFLFLKCSLQKIGVKIQTY